MMGSLPPNPNPSKLISMRKLTATLCLTLALILGSSGVSWSADFQKGLTAYESGDYATALHEWTPLAKQSNAPAQSNLGAMYEKGQGVPKNDMTAVKWYKLAAKQGYANAQYNLGVMYRKGQGVPQDYETAVKWYKLAAEQGNVYAQYNLGQMYRRGQGVSQNYKTALKWYRLAAEQGHAYAQTNLGVMYGIGKGVIKDWVYAHMWLNIAASSGNKNAVKKRNIFVKRMTPAQIAEAQRLARECVRKKYKGC